MLLALALIYYSLVAFDAVFTMRRMKKFGLAVELNSLVKNACALLGIEFGLFATILAPASALSLLLLWTHFQVGFALLIGFRARLSYIQIQSLKFEKDIRTFCKENGIEIGKSSGAGKSAPPSARSADTSVVAQPPSNSKDDKC